MGITFQMNTLEEMCDAMCDNIIPEDNSTLTGCTPCDNMCHEGERTMTMTKRNARTQRYQDKAIRRVTVKINRFTESDILDKIEEQDNLQGYIKELIRKDIEQSK